MSYAAAAILFLSVAAFWLLPVWLGVRAAEARGRSPHWMWFGLHPFGGWISWAVLRFGAAPLRLCPNCAEWMKAHARVCAYCTAPLPAAAPPARRPVSRAGWVVMGGITAFLTLVLAGAFAATSLAFSEAEGPLVPALARADADARVQAAFGTPLRKAGVISGSWRTSGGSGEADVEVPVAGPRGKGTLFLHGIRQEGRWRADRIAVEAPDGTRIQVPGEPGPEVPAGSRP